MAGTVESVGNTSNFAMYTDQKSFSPKLDLTGTISISKTQDFTFGLHGIYSRNLYNRTYSEQDYETGSYESEMPEDFSCRPSIICPRESIHFRSSCSIFIMCGMRNMRAAIR